MLNVQILCIGKLKEKYLREAVDEYTKRLSSLCKFSVVELPEERAGENPSKAEVNALVKKESEKLLSKISSGAYVIAMCVEGKNISSEELSQKTEAISQTHSSIAFVIGGSWGLSDALKSRSDLCLSMGRMTFPHQLFRVMLCEQIYRAFQISKGTKYHK